MATTLFTSRFGGVSQPPFDELNLALHVGDNPESVASNRSQLAELMGISRERFIYMEQVHGDEVAIVTKSSVAESPPIADALFTLDRDIALVVLTADCIPLLLYAQEAVAAVHVGRKGLVAGVIERVIETFNSFDIPNSDIRGAMGPAICGQCYEVDLDMYLEITERFPATATSIEAHSLDLVAGAKSILANHGITAQSSDMCTAHSEGYFSYRRDGRTGRQCGVIAR
jgi:YfiH family protein